MVCFSYSPTFSLEQIFCSKHGGDIEYLFGGRDCHGQIIYYKIDDDNCSEYDSLSSLVCPTVTDEEGNLVLVNTESLKIEKKNVQLVDNSEMELQFETISESSSTSTPLLIHQWGKVLYVVSLVDGLMR